MVAPVIVGPPPVESAPLPPHREAAGGVRMLAGVPYAAFPGSPAAGARPVVAAGPDPDVPAVVFLHGGGWRLGSRHGAGPAYAGASPNPFELVAQSGIAVASVDYRLSGEAGLARATARREGGRPLATGPGRRDRRRSASGSPPGASPPAATSPSC